MARMAREWIAVQDRLEKDILKLAQELSKKAAAGEVATQAQLWQMDRYQSLLAQTRTQVSRYAGWAEGSVSQEQLEMGLLGQAHAGSAIQAYGIAGTFDRLQPEVVRAMVGLTGDGSPVKDLLLKGWPDSVDGLTKALLDGTALGWNPRKTAREMQTGVDRGLDRMIRIARTEQIRVYRASTLERFQDSGVVTGYKRIAAKQERTCLPCLLLDGTEYDVDEELDDHVNGRCAMVPIVRDYADPSWPSGRDWFDDLDEDAQARIMGPGNFAKWQDGEVELDDLITRTHDKVWGDSVGVRSLGA
jgi:SPP1 gp7 family putative phage head morphogenesis protein